MRDAGNEQFRAEHYAEAMDMYVQAMVGLDEHFFAEPGGADGGAPAATVMEPGDFAVRGGVIDVFPPDSEEPVRLDFFGDSLESIRTFDPETQRSNKHCQSYEPYQGR